MAVIFSFCDDFYQSLATFYDMVSCLYGPNVQQVVLQNKEKTIDRFVRGSQELYYHFQPKNDVMKVFLSSLKTQNLLNKDGGLFAALLSSSVILKCRSEEISYKNFCLSQILISEKIRDIVRNVSIEIDIGKLGEVTCILKPVLCTKLLLKVSEVTHLCLLFAKTFAKTFASLFPQNNIDSFPVLLDDCSDVTNSDLFDGFFLKQGKSIHSNYKLSSPLSDKRVILVAPSLGVSSEQFIADPNCKLKVFSIDYFKNNIVFGELLEFCKKLIKHSSIVICQKVVHPLLKSFFQTNEVICIERVGSSSFAYLEKICGCKAIPTLLVEDFEHHIGKLDLIQYKKLGENVYLNLVSSLNPCKTLFLCSTTETEGEVLKNCYYSCMTVLHSLLLDSGTLYGGGCLETVICGRLMDASFDIPQNQGPPRALFEKVLKVIIHSLVGVASKMDNISYCFQYIDQSFHHHWISITPTSSCCCGLIKKHDHNLKFLSFEEMFTSNFHGGNEMFQTLEVKKVSFLCQSKAIFLNNLDTAFQVVQAILRIGCTISGN